MRSRGAGQRRRRSRRPTRQARESNAQDSGRSRTPAAETQQSTRQRAHNKVHPRASNSSTSASEPHPPTRRAQPAQLGGKEGRRAASTRVTVATGGHRGQPGRRPAAGSNSRRKGPQARPRPHGGGPPRDEDKGEEDNECPGAAGQVRPPAAADKVGSRSLDGDEGRRRPLPPRAEQPTPAGPST